MKKVKKTVPVFFAGGRQLSAFLAVSLKSVKENASKECVYKIYILHSGLKGKDAEKIMKLDEEGFEIAFVDVSERLGRRCGFSATSRLLYLHHLLSGVYRGHVSAVR